MDYLFERLEDLIEQYLEGAQFLKALEDLPPQDFFLGFLEGEVAFYLGAHQGVELDDRHPIVALHQFLEDEGAAGPEVGHCGSVGFVGEGVNCEHVLPFLLGDF